MSVLAVRLAFFNNKREEGEGNKHTIPRPLKPLKHIPSTIRILSPGADPSHYVRPLKVPDIRMSRQRIIRRLPKIIPIEIAGTRNWILDSTQAHVLRQSARRICLGFRAVCNRGQTAVFVRGRENSPLAAGDELPVGVVVCVVDVCAVLDGGIEPAVVYPQRCEADDVAR